MKRSLPAKSRRGGAKAVAFTPAAVSWDFLPMGAKFQYAREVGDGLDSPVISPVLNWMMRAVPQAPRIVERRDKDNEGLWVPQHQHPMKQLVDRPNPYYSGRALWMATSLDYCFGEAFWLKVRNMAGEVVELYWTPRALMTPKPMRGDAQPLQPGVIDHYEYRVNGQPKELKTDDVVHFRFGCNPRDPLRGYSQLAAMYREVYIDDQAASFTAAILRNLGIIGIVFSPDGTASVPPGKLEEFKNYIQQNFTGDKRGQALAFSQATKAQILQYNLQGFDVGPIRDISEERVSAAIGVPAAVIGFGTGLQQTKVGATMREMVQMAWRQAVIPTQEDFADELNRSLLPEFHDNENLFRFRFDIAKVHGLWEDSKDKSDRVIAEVEGSLLTVGEGRRELGYAADEIHDYYLRKVTVQAVPADDPLQPVARVTETSQTPPPEPPPEKPVPPQEPAGAEGAEE